MTLALSPDALKNSTAITSQSLLTAPTGVIDFEIYSEADLKEVGAWCYAEHPTTEVICLSYKLPGKPTRLWTPLFSRLWPDGKCPHDWIHPSDEFPEEINEFIRSGGCLEAHNAGFERAIWRHVMIPRYHVEPAKRWKDTMAACAYRALPLSLDDVGIALDLKTRKDPRGRYLIQKLCKPIKATKKIPQHRNFDPALLLEMFQYCVKDSDTEHGLGERVGNLTQSEQRIWVLDQKINDRGVYVDSLAVNAALAIVEKIEIRMLAELSAITGGLVNSASELKKMSAWLHDQGCHLDDLKADTVDAFVDGWRGDKNDPVYRVLVIRRTLGRASTKKLYRYLSCTAQDGRIHYLLQYHGASTGRWAGRLLQPQNFPRGDEAILQTSIDYLIDLIEHGDVELLELLYGDPLELISSALRGMILAAPGNRLYVADFSAIEARVLAWVAHEEWKIDAFFAIDRGEGYKGSDDMYCAAAAEIYGYPVSKKKNKTERSAGKICELAFGYQGGIGAWRKFDKSDKWTDEEIDEYKVKWRKSNSNIQAFWFNIEAAAVRCVLTGRPQEYHGIIYEMVHDAAGDWLACRLPNGRRIWYYSPFVETYFDKKFNREKHVLHYMGKDNKKGGSWSVIQTYGGMLTENIVQAISRDLMVEAMIRLEQAGYPIVLTIHDEIVCETPDDFGSLEEFGRLMTVVPEWFAGFPLHCDKWTGVRYHKE
jgi:DNA polymerase bacteriophage-type